MIRLSVFNVCLVYPFIWVWTVVGAFWLRASHECLPTITSVYWFVCLLVYTVSYLSIFGLIIGVALRASAPGTLVFSAEFYYTLLRLQSMDPELDLDARLCLV